MLSQLSALFEKTDPKWIEVDFSRWGNTEPDKQKKDYRTFKINRMLQMAVLPESFAGQDFSPPPVDDDDIASNGLVHLQLWFSAAVAYRVYDEFDPQNVLKNEDGSFSVTIDLPGAHWLDGFLLSFGTAVRVIEP